jgi:chemotaxis protein CheY-P-specific phosphatase CheC
MSIDVQEKIGSIFLDTVETLTFMFGDPVDKDDVPHMDVEWSQTRIDFKGAKSGYLALTVPSAVCTEIAANIMGLDEEEITDSSVSFDALKELLNVVSGHIVPSLQGEDNDFVLSIPSLETIDGNACFDLKNDPGTTCFNLDGNPVLLTLRIE